MSTVLCLYGVSYLVLCALSIAPAWPAVTRWGRRKTVCRLGRHRDTIMTTWEPCRVKVLDREHRDRVVRIKSGEAHHVNWQCLDCRRVQCILIVANPSDSNRRTW